MKGASALTLDDILRDKTSPNASIIEASRALAENMANLLEQMEVADAIARVVELLRQASCARHSPLMKLIF